VLSDHGSQEAGRSTADRPRGARIAQTYQTGNAVRPAPPLRFIADEEDVT
jgi:hypothetical protein